MGLELSVVEFEVCADLWFWLAELSGSILGASVVAGSVGVLVLVGLEVLVSSELIVAGLVAILSASVTRDSVDGEEGGRVVVKVVLVVVLVGVVGFEVVGARVELCKVVILILSVARELGGAELEIELGGGAGAAVLLAITSGSANGVVIADEIS